MKRAATIGLLLTTTALAGCMSSPGPNEGAGTVIGGGLGAVTGGLMGGAIGGSTGAVVGAVTGGVLGGVAGNAIGRDLDERDRQLALDAEMAAFESGQRRPWRGARGVYGYVEPGAGICRHARHLPELHAPHLRERPSDGTCPASPACVRTASGRSSAERPGQRVAFRAEIKHARPEHDLASLRRDDARRARRPDLAAVAPRGRRRRAGDDLHLAIYRAQIAEIDRDARGGTHRRGRCADARMRRPAGG